MEIKNTVVPYVVEQTNRGERSYDIYSRLLNDRIIVLSDEVNDATASVIVAQLLYLEGQDPEKDISFYINSPGGSVSAGLAIYDTMQYIKCDVSTKGRDGQSRGCRVPGTPGLLAGRLFCRSAGRSRSACLKSICLV